jgi:hypothetical protein
MTLFTWFSTNNQSSEALSQLQHRVRSAQRSVDYPHVLNGKPRGLYEKFHTSSKRSRESYEERGSRQNPGNQFGKLTQHDLEEETLWMYQYDDASSTNNNDGQASSSSSKPTNKDGGFFRRLFDQFVGEEYQDGGSLIVNATNVTTEMSNSTVYNNETFVEVTTTSEWNETQYKPLRIRAILAESTGNGDQLTETERNALFHDMLSPALLSWSSSLRVEPVVGNLTVDVSQLLDGETCGPGRDSGLPSIRVPLGHLTEGIPDTDMIVYLSLGFVIPRNGSNTTNSTTDGGGESDEGAVDTSRRWSNRYPSEEDEMAKKKAAEEELDTETIQDAYLNAPNAEGANESNSTMRICTGEYLAAASFCSTDQYDRPTAALLHICIDEHFFDPDQHNRNILTLMHELGHALGFNSLSMAHFRRQDGTPYTNRTDKGDIPDSKIECTGPRSERQWANVALPSEEILQFREVRGGVRVAELVTPSVVQVVRNQFDCQLLTGAELESGEGLPLSIIGEGQGCIGDHWERRLFSNDLMNPVIDDLEYSLRISTMTLAYFADSGWYQVDLSGAKVAQGWGRGAGCNFVNDTCIGKNGEVPPQNAPFFCNEIPTSQSRSVASEVHGCTPDLSRKAMCSMGQYNLELPWEYQYFHSTYGPDVGGNDPLMDYCPVYSGYENGLCASSETAKYMQANAVERFGERNSRCIIGNLDATTRKTALCLPIACVIEDLSLLVKVDRTWHLCEEAGQELTGGDVTIVCPDPRRICPTFYCPYDCLGTGGQCDYGNGKCLCPRPGIFIGDQVLLQVCGLDQNNVSPKDSFGPFLRPLEPDRENPAIPRPDSPLADYYVPTQRSLQDVETQLIGPWGIALIAISGGVLASALFWAWRKKQQLVVEAEWSSPRLGSTAEPATDGTFLSRNKDKMIAAVLVDMRIHHNASGVNESLAETDEHLTESEASRVRSESFSELSSRRSDSLPDEVDILQDELAEEDIQEAQRQAHIMRRRRGGA